MKQKLGKLTQLDSDLFKDSRGRYIMVDFKNKKAYLLSERDTRFVGLLKSGFLVASIALILLGTYVNWGVGFAAGVVVFIAIKIYYAKVFVPKLEEIESDDIPETSQPRYMALAEKGKTSLIVTVVICCVLPILLVFNLLSTFKENGLGFTDSNNVLLVVATVAITGYVLYMMINALQALNYLKKKEK